jgi:Ribbon-helix-helix protein, copG family
MKAYIVRLPEDLLEALKQHRLTTGTSAAELLRRAIRMTYSLTARLRAS